MEEHFIEILIRNSNCYLGILIFMHLNEKILDQV